MDFNDVLRKKISETEEIIKNFLPVEEGPQSLVMEAMNYSFNAGGKRLRPMLMLETFKLCGGNMDSGTIQPFMAAIEMIHTYSLIHDDLPAMDNDDYRRGKLTTWKKYGEGVAVLAGDGLLNYAFETAIKAYEKAPFDIRIASALKVLSGKAGIYGMIGGQTIDVTTEGQIISEELLWQIYKGKTAALLESAMTIGGILAGASTEQTELLESAAENIGLAFQVQDDILDVTSTSEVLGKPVGSDIKNQKNTYVSIYGLDNAREKVLSLTTAAMESMEKLEADYPNYDSEFLNTLLKWLINRNI